MCGGCQPAVVGHGRIQVHQSRPASGRPGRPCAPGAAIDQRHAATALEERVLVPPVPLVVVIAVVADEDDQRVVPELEPVERVEHAADLRVHEGDAGVVGAQELHAVLVGEGVEGRRESAARHGERRHGRDVGRVAIELQRAGRIEVEVLLRARGTDRAADGSRRRRSTACRRPSARSMARMAWAAFWPSGWSSSVPSMAAGPMHHASLPPVRLRTSPLRPAGVAWKSCGLVPGLAAGPSSDPAPRPSRRPGGRSCRRRPRASRAGGAVAAW